MKTLIALLCAMMLAVSAPALAAEKDAKAAAKPAAAQAKPDDKIDINAHSDARGDAGHRGRRRARRVRQGPRLDVRWRHERADG